MAGRSGTDGFRFIITDGGLAASRVSSANGRRCPTRGRPTLAAGQGDVYTEFVVQHSRLNLARGLGMKKQEVLEMIDRLPEEIDPEQLMHELYLRAKLERAEAAVARGAVVEHDEIVRHVMHGT